MTEDDNKGRRGNSHIQFAGEDLHAKLSKEFDNPSFDIGPDQVAPDSNPQEVELTDDERAFLLVVERGDAASTKSMLDNQTKYSLNVNCHNSLGKNALHISIENEHLELLILLLKYNLEIGDSLLHAIAEESVEAVEIILQAMTERPKKKDLLGLLGNASSTYTSDITPLILASHKDNYHIIKILLARGDAIPKPHDLRCSCHECIKSHKEDGLRHSRSRINAYKALASPSLICLSSKDPILTAFELSWELTRLGKLENEFREDYEQLSIQCHRFATSLMAETRGSSELTVILNYDHEQRLKTSKVSSNETFNDDENISLARLKLAIKYEQKLFIAHPHCQQLLASRWYEGLPGIRKLSFVNQCGLITLICSMFPLLSITYLFAPKSRIGALLKKPFIKFLCHQSSHLLFLLLIAASSMKIEFVLLGGYQDRINNLGPPPSFIEWGIIFYLTGLVWKEIKELYSNDLKTYLSNMWNLLDFSTNALYIATFALRIAAYIRNPNQHVYRGDWKPYEPVLISESLFAGANIVCTLKLVYMFTMSPTLGPLQITLGRMLGDILNFFSLYVLVLVAYAIGFQELYWFYAYERGIVCQNVQYTYQSTGQDLERYQYCTVRGRYFTNIFEITQTLYWSLYGLVDVSLLNLEHKHEFTEFIGKLMFGSFCYITVIMLLNMFIAMMNTSYQIISEQSDTEWKFARSKLWISYFKDNATVPVPFNIIPGVKSCYYFFVAVRHLFGGCNEKGKKKQRKSIRKLIKEINEKDVEYDLLIKDLIKRYLISRQKNDEKQGVTEDDLNEIKGDISSFRFELIEIFQMNGMKIPEYVTSKTISKLRRKGSRKRLDKIARKYNFSVNKNTNKNPPLKTNENPDSNSPQLNGKFQSFQNEAFVIDERSSKAMNTLLGSVHEYVRRHSSIHSSNVTQPLNASDLLHESVAREGPGHVSIPEEAGSPRADAEQRTDMV